jgi:hypothetical protein
VEQDHDRAPAAEVGHVGSASDVEDAPAHGAHRTGTLLAVREDIQVRPQVMKSRT